MSTYYIYFALPFRIKKANGIITVNKEQGMVCFVCFFLNNFKKLTGFPDGTNGQEPACQC